MTISHKDKDKIRRLAGKIAEIAALPEQKERMDLHRSLNALKPKRPVVMIDQIPWHELNNEGELDFQCENEFCCRLEYHMRRLVYKWRHMPGDMVVEPYCDIQKVVKNTGFGIKADEDVAVQDPQNMVKGHLYHDQLSDEADVEKIKTPEILYDKQATERDCEKADVLLGDLLTVRPNGRIPNFAPWDRLAEWRGAQEAIMDLALRPDHVHALMRRLTDAQMAMLDQLEAQDALGPHQDIVHCTGAYCDELKATRPDNDHAVLSDCWGFGMAQIFSTVSPQMHADFEVPYFTEYAKRFGLIYYGCCEPLDDRMDIVRSIPNVRKVSMSPWVDIERGARAIGSDFVFSRKPSPAFLARDEWHPEDVEKDLRQTAELCKAHGCPLEFILKDISTVHYEPQRLWQWNDIAMRVVEDYA